MLQEPHRLLLESALVAGSSDADSSVLDGPDGKIGNVMSRVGTFFLSASIRSDPPTQSISMV